jgi:transketolase
MMNVPITIVGVGAGFGYEDSGPTHHLLEDLAVLRAFPHVEINSITDAVMARKIAEASLTKETTNYVRLDRKLSADLYTEESAFDDGMCILKDGRDGYIIATGIMTHVALEVSNSLAEAGHDVGVVDLYTLPVNIGNFEKLADRSEFLITMEEHFLAGGLGSAICEALQDIGRLVPVKRIGLPVDRGYCYVYGGRERLRQYYGVGFDQSVETVSQFIGSMA